jgi:hypothetical protein
MGSPCSALGTEAGLSSEAVNIRSRHSGLRVMEERSCSTDALAVSCFIRYLMNLCPDTSTMTRPLGVQVPDPPVVGQSIPQESDQFGPHICPIARMIYSGLHK